MQYINPVTKEVSRGFAVYVLAPKSKYRKKEKVLVYPALYSPYFSGRQAISILETFKTRKLKAWAVTETLGELEELTLDEMKEVVL